MRRETQAELKHKRRADRQRQKEYGQRCRLWRRVRIQELLLQGQLPKDASENARIDFKRAIADGEKI